MSSEPYVSNVAWLPYSKALHTAAVAEFEKRMYNDKQCSRCEYLAERHCDVCDTCPAFLGHYRMWRRRRDKHGNRMIGLPLGRRKLIREVAPGTKFRDRRVRTAMRRKIKFTATLRPEQRQAVKTMAKKGYGLLEAPPRSGKTVMAIAVACALGYKTLILANQHEFIGQFLETIIGNPANGIPAFTNANALGGLGKVVGLCKTEADFRKYDICLATYQTFLSEKGQALLKIVAPLFGTVIVDEAHKVAAHCFLKVVNVFPAAVRFGVTGTPERKDGRNVLTEYVLGPVNYLVEVETLVPRVVMIETGTKLPRKYKMWTAFESALAEHAERNRLIIKHAVADIKAGRNIVIPVTRVHHAVALAKAINRVYGESVAAHFIGSQSKAERKSVIEKARNGLIKCVVGMRQLVQLGINVPAWDTIYEVMPISNAPNLHQETSRVRTPNPGKSQPMVKHFIEDNPQSRGCLRTCYWGTYRPEGFVFHARDKQVVDAYMGRADVTVREHRPVRL